MYKIELEKLLEQTINRHPMLSAVRADIESAYTILADSYLNGRKLLICGNGGSASDAEHIVGELMKSFAYNRVLSNTLQQQLQAASTTTGDFLAKNLQPALRAISLTCHSALYLAIANDIDPGLVFAQQVIGYGDPGDVLLAISTSGNSINVVNAVYTANALGLTTIGLTGKKGGQLKESCDLAICVDAIDTAAIQELHLPVYHTLCKMLEFRFFGQTQKK